jgi:hypothetical protein
MSWLAKNMNMDFVGVTLLGRFSLTQVRRWRLRGLSLASGIGAANGSQ